MAKSARYSPEVRERAVRMVFEHEREHTSQWAAILSIAGKIGCTTETLRTWVRRRETDTGRRGGVTSDERARMKELERKNRELLWLKQYTPREPNASWYEKCDDYVKLCSEIKSPPLSRAKFLSRVGLLLPHREGHLPIFLEFLETRCVIGNALTVERHLLYSHYCAWGGAN